MENFMAGLTLGFVAMMLIINSGPDRVAELKQDAISVGVAEYYLDAEHEKQFRWKVAQQKEEQK